MLHNHPLRTAIQTIACVTALIALPGCEEGTGTDGAGGSTSTDFVEFSALNFESEAKFIGPRLHTIVSETYRNLHYIHLFLRTNGSTIEDKMADAGPILPVDDLLDINFADIRNITIGLDTFNIAPDAAGVLPGDEDCGENEGVETKFIDADANNTFSTGDQILRDFGNVGCQYDFYSDPTTAVLASGNEGRPAYWPSNITGSILYEFDGDNLPADDIFSGTVTFGDPNVATALNLEVSGGLLAADDNESDASFNGTLNFDVNFDTGYAIFTNISVTLTGGTSSIAGPVTFTISEVERQVDVGGQDIITIEGGAIESQTSGQRFTFSTQPFNNLTSELRGPTGITSISRPNEGAIVMQGGNNSSVRVRSEVGVGGGIVELDLDGDGIYNDAPEAEPNGWSWFVRGFLMREGAFALD